VVGMVQIYIVATTIGDAPNSIDKPEAKKYKLDVFKVSYITFYDQ